MPQRSDVRIDVNALNGGAVAIIFCDDQTQLDDTLAWCAAQGFRSLLVFGDTPERLVAPEGTILKRFTHNIRNREDVVSILNVLHKRLHGRWLYFCYNAEYLFYPFHGTRRIEDLTAFMTEERRDCIHGYQLDLYVSGHVEDETTLNRERAFFDAKGYYGAKAWKDGQQMDREFAVYGGLARRFQDFVPWDRQRINRAVLYRARRDLVIDQEFCFNDPEYNTISCPWHRNITVAIASFRVAKSLLRNPGSAAVINNFMWPCSERFDWSGEQLNRLGFMESGQWF